MKRMIAGLIGGVFFAGLFLGNAAASGDDRYEYGEYGEHGRYYNPYGNGYYNNGYRNHEMYEYGNPYRYQPVMPSVYVNPYYNNSSYGNGYRNHEAYEYGGYRR
ncbi:hypothetical protein GCAAIG_01250 [Candidatus Electronema halotolerans]